jgi:hypothetical protein
VSLKRGPSRFWSFMFQAGLVRARMPFWRVVVEGRLDRVQRRWPENHDTGVAAVFVWARTVEEAEGLASLALETEGLDTLTADAVKCPPAAAPRRRAAAVARTELRFLDRTDEDAHAPPPSPRGARA